MSTSSSSSSGCMSSVRCPREGWMVDRSTDRGVAAAEEEEEEEEDEEEEG